MATPTLTRHTLPGALGEILVDVRAGGRDAPRPAVFVVHGWKGFKDFAMFPPTAERLATAGFTAVTCNLSGSGVDEAGDFTRVERFGHDTYSAELADVATVIDALAAGDLGVPAPTAIGLVGHSRGGGTSVLQTARDERIRALVTWAAIARVDRWTDEEKAAWRRTGRNDVLNTRTKQLLPLHTDVLDDVERNAASLDILGAATRVDVPWLVVHGSDDESVPVREGRELAEASGSATTELLVVPDAGHGFGAVHPWAGMPAPFRLVLDRTVSWMARSLS